MPTYEYECEACGAKHEAFQSMSDKPLKTCPACQKPELIRLIGAGAGIIFKGSGFYETDYKRSGGGDKDKASASASSSSDKSSSSSAPASEAKPAATPAASTSSSSAPTASSGKGADGATK